MAINIKQAVYEALDKGVPEAKILSKFPGGQARTVKRYFYFYKELKAAIQKEVLTPRLYPKDEHLEFEEAKRSVNMTLTFLNRHPEIHRVYFKVLAALSLDILTLQGNVKTKKH